MDLLQRFLENMTGPELFTAMFMVAEFLALCSVPSVLLRRRGRPTAALAWLLALFALPALGGLRSRPRVLVVCTTALLERP